MAYEYMDRAWEGQVLNIKEEGKQRSRNNSERRAKAKEGGSSEILGSMFDKNRNTSTNESVINTRRNLFTDEHIKVERLQ